MREWMALGLCLVSLACGGNSATPAGAKSAGEEPVKDSEGPSRTPCGDHGLYALPGSPPSDVEDNAQGKAGLSAFRVAEEDYGKGDTSGASKKFLEAAQSLARVKGDEEVTDYARYAREVSYHNALWAAAEAGELAQMREAIKKSAGEDPALADTIKSLLGDEPTQCSDDDQ
jgi:hypothetical protein